MACLRCLLKAKYCSSKDSPLVEKACLPDASSSFHPSSTHHLNLAPTSKPLHSNSNSTFVLFASAFASSLATPAPQTTASIDSLTSQASAAVDQLTRLTDIVSHIATLPSTPTTVEAVYHMNDILSNLFPSGLLGVGGLGGLLGGDSSIVSGLLSGDLLGDLLGSVSGNLLGGLLGGLLGPLLGGNDILCGLLCGGGGGLLGGVLGGGGGWGLAQGECRGIACG